MTPKHDANKFIIAFCQTLGIQHFSLTEAVTTDDDRELSTISTLPHDSDKGVAAIMDHALLAHQYLFGSSDIKDPVILLLLIADSVLLAYSKSNSSKTINLDSLRKIDITGEILMAATPPTVGETFNTTLLSKLKKENLQRVEEESSAQAAKVLRLTGMSMLSPLNLWGMSPAQRHLFVGNLSNSELVDIIVNDVQAMKDEALKSWGVDKNQRGLCDQVEQSIIRIYGCSLISELAALKQEMKNFSTLDKKSYLEMIKSRPEGNVIYRARIAANRIMSEANDKSQPEQERTNEKAMAS